MASDRAMIRVAANAKSKTPAAKRAYTVARARKIQRFLSQPFHVAEVFTGSPGTLVPLKDTTNGFKQICDGKLDHLPENAFYMVGSIEEAIKKGEKLKGPFMGQIGSDIFKYSL